MRSAPSQPACSVRPPDRPRVWLPWLIAPAFVLLPIGGCGVAAGLRQGAAITAAPVEAATAGVPIAAIVTALPPAR